MRAGAVERLYLDWLRANQGRQDTEQRKAVRVLDNLATRITSTRFLNFAGSGARGIYCYGSVGRGKTLLMDSFVQSLSGKQVCRRHFHEMMDWVHKRLAAMGGGTEPLSRVAKELAAKCRVLCLDEFMVEDIADAMILYKFLEGFLRRGTYLVVTSNQPIAALYADGLQRERFLPAIRLMESKLEQLHLGGDMDYRLFGSGRAGQYLINDLEGCSDFFRRQTGTTMGSSRAIVVNGRAVDCVLRSQRVLWVDFDQISGNPLGTVDYLRLAEQFPAWIISGVPILDDNQLDPLKRFINMIDILADRQTLLCVSAEALPGRLYGGRRARHSFARTVSRLHQMTRLPDRAELKPSERPSRSDDHEAGLTSVKHDEQSLPEIVAILGE